jgi:hypothetical protein
MSWFPVADDNAPVSSAIGTWLARQGSAIGVAAHGVAGLSAPDGVTFDVTTVVTFMPPRRGLKSIRAFRQAASTVPPITISSYSRAARSDSPATSPAVIAACSRQAHFFKNNFKKKAPSFATIAARAVITLANPGAERNISTTR